MRDVGQRRRVGQQDAHVGQPLRADRGQRDAALGADEQGLADLVLQRADGLAQRRLGHVQAFGGAAEMQLLGHGDELAKMAQVHGAAFRYKKQPNID